VLRPCQRIYRLLDRYRQGGLEAVDPRSRRAASNPRAVPDEVIAAIVVMRETLRDYRCLLLAGLGITQKNGHPKTKTPADGRGICNP
jgi:hypothetical protein